MITERQMEQLPEIFVERYQAVYDKYLNMVGEHIKEIGTLSPTDIHRLEQIARMNKNLDEIKRDLENAAQVSTEELNRVFANVSTEQYESFANSYLAKGLVQTEILKQTALKRQINAIGKITENTFFNLSNTTAMSDLYKECLDTGILAVQQGLTDYKSAVREVIQKTAVEGNKVIIRSNETGEIKKVKDQITYESGYKRRRDTAVRMNVLDGVRDINQAIALHVGEEFGADGVEISVHGNCAEDHLYIQGKQYSLKAYEKLQESLKRRIGVWNCHHFAMPIILGISKPLYSQKELDEINRRSTEEITINGTTKTRYEWTQVQRRIETKVREQKDIANVAKASSDDALRRVAQAKINKYADTYEYISQKAGIPTKKERMSVSGFRAVKAKNNVKTVDKSLKNDIIKREGVKKVQSGAFYGALNPESDKDFERCEEHAKKYYNEIRNRKTDIDAIAKNVGYSIEKIRTVKEHIFLNKYDLGEDEPTNFYPNYDIAVSWQNLISGKNIEDKDIILLEHEYYEYNLMHEKGLSYIQAHNIAQEKFNYHKAVKDWRNKK